MGSSDKHRWINIFFILALFIGMDGVALAQKSLTYKDLVLKDLDQMNTLIKAKIKESKEQEDTSGVAPLREALRLLMSRPDTDNMIDKILPSLQKELDAREAWNRVVGELAEESLNLLKDPKETDASLLVTHLIFLENLMAELKPDLKNEGPVGGLAKGTFEKIRDAEIKLPKQVKEERFRNIMKSQLSPSTIAERALKSLSKK